MTTEEINSNGNYEGEKKTASSIYKSMLCMIYEFDVCILLRLNIIYKMTTENTQIVLRVMHTDFVHTHTYAHWNIIPDQINK